MLGAEVQWLIGAAFAFVGLIGGVVARDRYVMRLVNGEDETTRKMVREEADKLHERLNRTRDEYVRRVDLDGHIIRLEGSVRELANEMRSNTQSTNHRLDAVLAHLVNNKQNS